MSPLVLLDEKEFTNRDEILVISHRNMSNTWRSGHLDVGQIPGHDSIALKKRRHIQLSIALPSIFRRPEQNGYRMGLAHFGWSSYPQPGSSVNRVEAGGLWRYPH